MLPWGSQSLASPRTRAPAAVPGRLRPVVQTGVGRSSQVAGEPRPRRPLRPLHSRVDGQLVEGRIIVPAGGGRRPGAGGRGPEGGAGRSAEQRGGAGRATGLEERGRCLPGQAAFGLLNPKETNRKREPGGPGFRMEEQGHAWKTDPEARITEPGSRGLRGACLGFQPFLSASFFLQAQPVLHSPPQTFPPQTGGMSGRNSAGKRCPICPRQARNPDPFS